MPMALRPGTTATRAATALIERAMSSASPMTREDLVPGAGSSSYSVTTGPGRTLVISPLTPKSWSTPSSSRAFSCSTSSLMAVLLFERGCGCKQLERRGLVGRVAPLHAGAGMLFLLRGARDAIVGLGDVVALVVLLLVPRRRIRRARDRRSARCGRSGQARHPRQAPRFPTPALPRRHRRPFATRSRA